MIARFLTSIFFVSAFLTSAGLPAASAVFSGHGARNVQRFQRLVFRGDTALTTLSAQVSSRIASPVRRAAHYRRMPFYPTARRRSQAFAGARILTPVAPNLPVVGADADFFGFLGLTDVDQFNAGTGAYANSQVDLEPPDQGLCVGDGFVVDAVNNAVAVYSSLGTPLTAPTSLSQFFRLPPEDAPFNAPQAEISDPKCYFDRDTQRWFLTESEIDYPKMAFPSSSILIGVSHSGDPTAGYSIFAIDTSDLSGAGCNPCFGDQPLLGADAYGLFISTNEFQVSPGPHEPPNGSQIYAISKLALVNHELPTVVQIDAGALPTPDPYGQWYSIQPASAPDTSVASNIRNGTEFFLSALDFAGANDNRIAVWALTNTESLSNTIPNVELQDIVIGSEGYGLPPPAVQKVGPAPLATSMRSPIEELDTNDDRMNQVVFADGRLWSGLNTAVRSGSAVNAGIAFFSVVPALGRSGLLAAKIDRQGYVAVAGQNMLFPSIGVNSSGGALMTATLSGTRYYPTPVYVTPDGKVHIAGISAGPDDGISGISGVPGIPGVGRWGDYSAAVADQDGSIWFATEYIPGERTILANWGTFIGHVRIRH